MNFDCARPVTAECVAEQARRGMQAATVSPAQVVEHIQHALTAAGFTDIAVRPAGPADPAPEDTIVYAVPIGAGCVVGYLAGNDQNSGQQRVLGTPPGGRCLA